MICVFKWLKGSIKWGKETFIFFTEGRSIDYKIPNILSSIVTYEFLSPTNAILSINPGNLNHYFVTEFILCDLK